MSESVSTKELDQAVKHAQDLREAYKQAKKLSDEAYRQVEMAEAALILLMERADKTAYIAEGVGRVGISHKMSIQTPKSPEERRAFFAWLAEKKGQEVADAYMSINANSLNSLYNQLTEEAALAGEILEIPGLGEPVARVTLSLTKA